MSPHHDYLADEPMHPEAVRRLHYSHLSQWAEVQVVLRFRPWRARQAAYFSGAECLSNAINQAQTILKEQPNLPLIVIDDTGPRWAHFPTFDPQPGEE